MGVISHCREKISRTEIEPPCELSSHLGIRQIRDSLFLGANLRAQGEADINLLMTLEPICFKHNREVNC